MPDGPEILSRKKTGFLGSGKPKNHIIVRHYRLIVLCCLAFQFIGGCSDKGTSSFVFRENSQGTGLFEKGRAVYFYQREARLSEGKYLCNHYLHPLLSIDGDTLTREFPADHPYHRGIYWAWHQIYIDSLKIGDGWVMDSIYLVVNKVQTGIDHTLARLSTDVEWKSPVWQKGRSFVQEQSTIWVHPLQNDIRRIDFEIRLRALVPGVYLGGSDDEKGYGGFCARIKLPPDLSFTSSGGPVIPQNLQVKAGPWMDFSGFFGPAGGVSGMAILCYPGTPNYPAPWILRNATSMQNIVFPGRQRINLPMDKPIVLRYRMIVHRGNARQTDMAALQAEYNEYVYPEPDR
jgi:hypothetical protein